jgi:Ca2+-binding RTX toxin-like protein
VNATTSPVATQVATKGRRRARRSPVAAALLLSLSVLSPMAVLSVPGAANGAPTGQGFELNASDLQFILKQIKFAENNATREAADGTPVAGLPLFGSRRDPATNEFLQISSPLLPYGLRTVDGSDNNGISGQSHYGAASKPFPRFAPPQWRDADLPGVFGPPGAPRTSYTQKSGVVVDSEPRVISNLIVDQTSTNPAAIAAAGKPHRAFNDEATAIPCTTDPDRGADPPTPGIPDGCVPSHETLFIPNVTTDVGLSPPYNSWFTLFGQFFDHGVDLTVKSGGTVMVPLKDDDPLIAGPDHVLVDNPNTPKNEAADNLPPQLRFMQLTRSKNLPGNDGVMGTSDDEQNATNVDSPWVDQSQTYTSHSSHQVFLRHYTLQGGKPVNDGRLLEGRNGGMSTWADVKAQASDMLGIRLLDTDVTNIPMVSTDQYGRFLRGPNGYPQIVTGLGPDGVPNTGDDVRVEGDPNANGGEGVPVAGAVRIDIGFLDDIAHHAVPTNSRTGAALAADADDDETIDDGVATTYDDEMLDAHFMAGDGRVNENIGLTAIHQVFHSEHNRLVTEIDAMLHETGNESLLGRYQHLDHAAGYTYGERLFQAARFVTEMEYQHLVFEEFARMVQPGINPFNVFTQSDTGINPAIHAEFAHAVYRFGHSMLTDTMARTNPDGSTNDLSLLEAFLNPPAYYDDGNGGSLTPEQAAGSIAQGMTDQVGNELDEFVAETLRNNLLGLPLDLPTINMTRAREAGVPSLNNFRKSIHEETGDASLKPYTDWVDFGLGIKHQESLVNFIAAYGTHGSINGNGADNAPGGGDDFTPTLESRRQAATAIVHNDTFPAPADSVAFLNSSEDWETSPDGAAKTGLDAVDLWVGGLAESQNLFGGLLGSTFNYVFERQLTDLQDGDRLYYLSRTSGMNLRTQLEGNSFAELIQRNTTAEGLKAHSFDTNDCEFVLSHPTYAGTGNTIQDDPTSECDESKVLIRMADGTIRYRQNNSVDPPGLNAQNMFKGTPNPDKIWGGVDNDTFWGDEGDDRIEGSDGSDSALGGDGNDIITDSAGDDVHKGGRGNDAIDGGPGLDIIMGGPGSDFSDGGLNSNDTFAAEGNDFVIAGGGPDTVFGGGGDDWQEGGNANDLLQGDNGAPFFDDINKPGHDVLVGGSGEDDYDAEGGDDIMVAGPGIERNHGTRGYDWVAHARSVEPADSDLNIHINNAPGQLADRHLLTEAVSGWDKNDDIKGDNWAPIEQDVELHQPWGSNALTVAGINRIDGLMDVLGQNHVKHYVDPQLPGDEGEGGPPATGTPLEIDGFGDGNILLGGGGSDVIRGRGADDIIDGDAWLDVWVRATLKNGNVKNVNSITALSADVFAGRLDPGQIQIIRQIRYGRSVAAPGVVDVDTAVYAGPRADYDLARDVRGLLTVTHARNQTAVVAGDDDQGIGFIGDGTDTLRNIERLQFADQVVTLSSLPSAPVVGAATGGDARATVNWTAGPANGPAISSHQIQVLSNGSMVRTVTGLPAGGTSAVVTGLTNGTTYTFKVIAVNATGPSAPSAASNAVTPGAAVTLLSTTPVDNATGVSLSADQSGMFSNSVTSANWPAAVTLRNATSGALVPRTVTYNDVTRTVTVNPNADLIPNTPYTLTFLGTGANGIRDAAGVRLVTTVVDFITVGDTTAPTVNASSPVDGATTFGLAANLTVDFSERVLGAQAADAVVLRNVATNAVIQAAVTVNGAGTRVTVNPTANLARNTQYRLTLTGGPTAIRDAFGNPLATTTITFRTIP